MGARLDHAGGYDADVLRVDGQTEGRYVEFEALVGPSPDLLRRRGRSQ